MVKTCRERSDIDDVVLTNEKLDFGKQANQKILLCYVGATTMASKPQNFIG